MKTDIGLNGYTVQIVYLNPVAIIKIAYFFGFFKMVKIGNNFSKKGEWFMTSAKKTFSFKAALSLVLAAAMMLGLFAGIITPANAAITTDDNGLLTFTDDFNRDTLTGDNSGWIELKTGDATNNKIEDGVLNLTDTSIENHRGYGYDLVMRPMSEAAIDQKASIEINNISSLPRDFCSANLHLRLLGTKSMTAGKNTGWSEESYIARVNGTYLQIQKVLFRHGNYGGDMACLDLSGGAVSESLTGINNTHTYKLEFSASGTWPTTLTATLYDVTEGKVVARAKGYDDTPSLQTAGTSALSACGGASNFMDNPKVALVDNFVYEQLDNSVFYDDFERAEVGNDWISTSATMGTGSNAGDLYIVGPVKATTANNGATTVAKRPMSEAAINQKASTTFSTIGHMGWTGNPAGSNLASANVFVRITDTASASTPGYFAAAGQTSLKLYKVDSTGKVTALGDGVSFGNLPVEYTYTTSGNYKVTAKYKLELVAEGTYPTKLTANLYDLINNELVYTYYYEDSTAELQQPGTTGVSQTGSTYARNGYFHDFSSQNLDNNIVFDNFDRTTGVSGDNSGWIEQGVVAGNVASGTNFIGNTGTETDWAGMLRMKSTAWGEYTKNVLLRPMSEAAIDQQVSISEAAMGHAGWYSSASQKSTINVHVRVMGTDSANVTSYFAALGQGPKDTTTNKTTGHLTIYKSDSTGKVTPLKTITLPDLNGNIKWRLSLKAEGTYPTVLTASVYNYTDNAWAYELEVADSTDELQTAGTAGVSIQGANRISKFDNFLYEYSEAADTVIIGDVDLDGDCDNDDVTAIRKHIIGADTAEGEYDINFDGNVDILDLVLAQRASQGETGGTDLDNTFYKLTTEKELNVAYFGGSITAGQGASNGNNCYRALTTQWLRNRFPDANIYETNAAIGGTGSAFGAYRAVRDLKLDNEAAKPDLVFIEFGVNDWLDTDADLKYDISIKDTIKANMESIIRAVYTANPDADIVILLTTTNYLYNWYGWDGNNNRWHWPQATAHNEIANEYGLPFVKIGPMLWNHMNSEINNKAEDDTRTDQQIRLEYLGDGVHPTDKGYEKYAEYLTAYLADAFAKTTAKAGTTASYMPNEPLYDVPVAPYCDTTFSGYDSVDAFTKNDSGHLVATEAGTAFNVTFKGSTLKLWNFSNTNSGDISVSVDGGDATTIELYRSGLNHKLYTLADGLDATATHTVTITLNTSANYGGSAMEIISFLVAGDADQSGVTISAVAAE